MSEFNERLKSIRKHHNPFKQFYNTNEVNILNNRNVKAKIKEVIKEAGLKTKEEVKPIINKFVRPSTDDEWKQFHKTNEEGINIAYSKPEGYHIQDNKLFIAGTRDMKDVLDWTKLPMNTFNKSKIYKNAEKALIDNPEITQVIGHSAGGSAALQLEKDYPNKGLTSITYSAPVFSIANIKQIVGKQEDKPMRFFHPGDLVSSMDMNAQPIFKAPEYNINGIANAIKVYNDPSPENIKNTFDSMTPENFDPMSLHTMSGYSQQSKTIDYVKSAVEGGLLYNQLSNSMM
jgi:hypothetical protein